MSATDDTVEPRTLAELESPSAKLVYLYVQTERGATIDDLHEALGIARISLYPLLRTLIQRGVVERDEGRYHCLD